MRELVFQIKVFTIIVGATCFHQLATFSRTPKEDVDYTASDVGKITAWDPCTKDWIDLDLSRLNRSSMWLSVNLIQQERTKQCLKNQIILGRARIRYKGDDYKVLSIGGTTFPKCAQGCSDLGGDVFALTTSEFENRHSPEFLKGIPYSVGLWTKFVIDMKEQKSNNRNPRGLLLWWLLNQKYKKEYTHYYGSYDECYIPYPRDRFRNTSRKGRSIDTYLDKFKDPENLEKLVLQPTTLLGKPHPLKVMIEMLNEDKQEVLKNFQIKSRQKRYEQNYIAGVDFLNRNRRYERRCLLPREIMSKYACLCRIENKPPPIG